MIAELPRPKIFRPTFVFRGVIDADAQGNVGDALAGPDRWIVDVEEILRPSIDERLSLPTCQTLRNPY